MFCCQRAGGEGQCQKTVDPQIGPAGLPEKLILTASFIPKSWQLSSEPGVTLRQAVAGCGSVALIYSADQLIRLIDIKEVEITLF